jgi:hypothetical protein
MRDIYISEHNAALLERVTRKKQELDKRRPLTQGELERLQEDFLVERSGFTSLDQSAAKLRWTVSLAMPPFWGKPEGVPPLA